MASHLCSITATAPSEVCVNTSWIHSFSNQSVLCHLVNRFAGWGGAIRARPLLWFPGSVPLRLKLVSELFRRNFFKLFFPCCAEEKVPLLGPEVELDLITAKTEIRLDWSTTGLLTGFLKTEIYNSPIT